MKIIHGKAKGPILLLHGGAGSQDPSGDALVEANQALDAIAQRGLLLAHQGASKSDIVGECLKGMEDCEMFNAGKGSALQADGMARLTAAYMDGARQRFSGVQSVSYVAQPSQMAIALQERSSRVLAGMGADLFARELQLPIETTLTEKRIERWIKRWKQSPALGDTVGCVLLTQNAELASGASTGGRGFEFPGRMSDSATVAGTYASAFVAIAATGTGEEIVDDALAARIETRVRDGMSLTEACQRCFDEALARKRSYGWIALDRTGAWTVAHTTSSMSYVIKN